MDIGKMERSTALRNIQFDLHVVELQSTRLALSQACQKEPRLL